MQKVTIMSNEQWKHQAPRWKVAISYLCLSCARHSFRENFEDRLRKRMLHELLSDVDVIIVLQAVSEQPFYLSRNSQQWEAAETPAMSFGPVTACAAGIDMWYCTAHSPPPVRRVCPVQRTEKGNSRRSPFFPFLSYTRRPPFECCRCRDDLHKNGPAIFKKNERSFIYVPPRSKKKIVRLRNGYSSGGQMPRQRIIFTCTWFSKYASYIGTLCFAILINFVSYSASVVLFLTEACTSRIHWK